MHYKPEGDRGQEKALGNSSTVSCYLSSSPIELGTGLRGCNRLTRSIRIELPSPGQTASEGFF